MNKLYYVCKYTPLELLEAMGAQCENLNDMPEGFDQADAVANPNMCGFGKSVLEAVLSGRVKELILVNCCDSIRSVYDVLEASGMLDFLYILDIPHGEVGCGRMRLAEQFTELIRDYGAYSGTSFDREAFQNAFRDHPRVQGPHLAVMGARMGNQLFEMVEEAMPYPVENLSCVNNRSIGTVKPPEDLDMDALMDWYAEEILRQIPCMRMMDRTGRRALYEDPNLVGIIYHTVKFCDFYSFEYAELKEHAHQPLLKIESDYTIQSSGQLATRLEAFAESLEGDLILQGAKHKRRRARRAQGADGTEEAGENGEETEEESEEEIMGKGYFAGIDSGSTSTDVVILDRDRQVVASIIMPTGAGAAVGAERALEETLKEAGLREEDLDEVVTTGYGRGAIQVGDKSITEITCHARGAHHLDPTVRTVIDIGGQDSKVIRLDETGAVVNFVMNDKCAAGTGRFLEMMARTMEMSLDELSRAGLNYHEDITISSMCTVFAESEVVSLIALNKETDDIVHGLNKAVTAKTVGLVKRVGGEERYMMTGGVAQNVGLVKTLEERLETKLIISDMAQLCGALGAALFAADLGGC